MDDETARGLLKAERDELEQLLEATKTAGREARDDESEQGDAVDPAAALSAESFDDTIAGGLTDRLAAVARAEERLAQGTFGKSIRSGDAIPEERLKAYPTAELTVEEAASS